MIYDCSDFVCKQAIIRTLILIHVTRQKLVAYILATCAGMIINYWGHLFVFSHTNMMNVDKEEDFCWLDIK